MGSLLQRPCASCSRADGPRLWAWHLNSYNLFSLFLHHHYERVAASVCFSPVIALTQRIRIRRHHLPGRPQAGSYAERLPRLVGARLRATGRLCIPSWQQRQHSEANANSWGHLSTLGRLPAKAIHHCAIQPRTTPRNAWQSEHNGPGVDCDFSRASRPGYGAARSRGEPGHSPWPPGCPERCGFPA
jgi:hypothetical protein